jgi:hypothetical protein
MPTGTCNFPDHHGGPGAGAPVGLLVAIAAGALVVIEWRTVLVVLAVVVALAVAGAGVAMLLHSHRAEPYDAAWGVSERQDAAIEPPATVTAESELLRSRVRQLERELADRRAIEAPQQHLHLHGVSAEDIAAIIARKEVTEIPHVNQ